MANFKVAVLEGDGIGPEVIGAATHVLEFVARAAGLTLEVLRAPVGLAAYEDHNHPVPPRTTALARGADAVLLGPIAGAAPAGPEVQHATFVREALAALQGWLGIYANLRPVRVHEALVDASPLKPDLARGLDVLVVRDVASGLYHGRPRGITEQDGRRTAVNTLVYTDGEIRRVAVRALECAATRRGQLVLADQAKQLETGWLWRQVVQEEARSHPDVTLVPMDLDRALLELTNQPAAFDTIVAANATGELLAAQASALTGTYGLQPSAFLGDTNGGVYAPAHGSAPDLAGKGVANPTAAILAVSMLLDHAANRPDLALAVRDAVDRALQEGARTCDICPTGVKSLTTEAFTDRVIAALRTPVVR